MTNASPESAHSFNVPRRSASRRLSGIVLMPVETHLLECPDGGRAGLGPVHLQGLLQGVPKVVEQFLPGLPLGVDARHFLDPPGPPLAVSLDDGGVTGSHVTPPTAPPRPLAWS